MRKLILGLVIAALAVPASAQVHVRGYTKKDGTYVAPHVRTTPNDSKYDNWSTSPNINPYTGKTGTVDPWAMPSTPRVSTQRAPTYQPYTAPKAPCYYNCPD